MKSCLLLAVAGLLFSSCATVTPSTPPPAPPPPPPAPVATEVTAPETFQVQLDTSQGPILLAVTRAEAPLGADRFYNLVQAKYFDGARFFRVVPGFVVQFGLAADPALSHTWDKPFADDPVKASNARGTLTFAATSSPNSRTTQLFISLGNNPRLDGMGFAPFGHVVSGMENVDRIFAGYGEGPDQDLITSQGNAYLEKQFPQLDYIKTARILP